MSRTRDARRRHTSSILGVSILMTFAVLFLFGGLTTTAIADDEPDSHDDAKVAASPTPDVEPTDESEVDSNDDADDADEGETEETKAEDEAAVEHEEEEVADEATVSGPHDDEAPKNPHEDDDAETDDAEAHEDTEAEVSGDVMVSITAEPLTVPAGGGDVTFTVVVQNDLGVDAEITTLTSGAFGALTGGAGCGVGVTIASEGSCSFTFTEHVTGELGAKVDVTVTATLAAGATVKSATDTVFVVVAGEHEVEGGALTVTKSADASAVPATGADVVFTFSVANAGDDEATIAAMSDDVLGHLTGDADCRVGTVLMAGASCSFTVTTHLSGAVGTHHVNVVTVTGEVAGETLETSARETVAFVAGTSIGGGSGGGGAGGGAGTDTGIGAGADVGAEVQGTTTAQAATAAQVAGAVEAATAETAAGELAFTGASDMAWPLVGIFAAFLLIGTSLLVVSRRAV